MFENVTIRESLSHGHKKKKNIWLTYLETHLAADGLEVGSSREEGNLDHAASSETSSEVGWASQDPAEVLGVHEVGAFGLKDLLDLLSTFSESCDDRFDIVALLH